MSDVQGTTTQPTVRSSGLFGQKTAPSAEEIGQSQEVQIQLEEGRAEEIAKELMSELETVQRDRSAFEDQLIEFERLYEARPEQERKTFPWSGASNLVVPVIATAVDTVMANIMNNLFGAEKIWKCTARASGWADLADPIENWLDWVGKYVMKLYQPVFRWFLGTVKFGTGIMKVVWERKLREVHYLNNGAEVSEFILTHDGPTATTIPLDKIFWSADADAIGNLQECSWVAHSFRKSWKQLKSDEASQLYYDVDRIKDATATEKSSMDAEREEETKIVHTEDGSYELYEFWACVDLKGDGVLSEIVMTVEKSTQTVLRAVYNFYLHQERPFHVIRYMPRDYGILGIGLCEMLAPIQDEISTIHNQRIDNATIANAKVFKRKRDSRIESLDIYPGAFVDVDEMDDIDAMELGSEHSSLLQEELHSNSIGEKRTAINDYSVGRESAAIGSNATATSVTALMREGAKRFDMTKRDFRSAIERIGHQVIMLYKQFAPNSEVMYEMFSEEEKRMVEEFFKIPDELSRNGIIIDVPAVNEINNKEIQQQVLMTLMQVIQQFYTSVMQAVQVATAPSGMVTPQIQQLAADAAIKGTKIYQRLLEAFDFRDADGLAPDIESILGMGGMMNGINGGTQPGTGVGGPTGAATPSTASSGQPAMEAGVPGGEVSPSAFTEGLVEQRGGGIV